MKPPSTNRPTQGQLVFPLMETIKEMGGRGKSADVSARLAEKFELPDDVVRTRVERADGQTLGIWNRHVRFARQKAKSMGYVASGGTGLWDLTDEGFAGLEAARTAVVVEFVVDARGMPIGARVNVRVGVPTTHMLAVGDARSLHWIGDGEIPLVVTSPPYFDLKAYRESGESQLGDARDYEEFLEKLDAVWRECLRVLSPGGRLAINVGDVLRSRKTHGRHHVLPLHADILARGTRMGFDALTGIYWNKKANCAYEAGSGGILGQPGQPNQIIKSEIEHILLLRKPGDYRKPTENQRRDAFISKDEHDRFFTPIWSDVPGARTNGGHPAPFPVEIPYRLARMFSFPGDVVLDPFGGSGTTAIACAKAGRNSVIVDISPEYVAYATRRLHDAERELGHAA